MTVQHNSKGWEMVPSGPFQAWLQERIAMYDGELNAGLRLDDVQVQMNTTFRLAAELGWTERRLWRYLNGKLATSAAGIKGDIDTDWFPRRAVEDALTRCGVQFWELYPEIAAEEDRPFEPERWCPECVDRVTVLDGRCAWCDWQFVPVGQMRRAA